MKTMAVDEFQSQVTSLIDEISLGSESIVITKDGKPIADLVPHRPSEASMGQLADWLVFEDDIVSPLGEEMWKSAE